MNESSQPPRPPPQGAAAMTYRDKLAEVREFVRRHSAHAGLSARRTRDLVLAASEVAANTLRHTDAPGLVRIWSQLGEVICEFQDTGSITHPQAGQFRPVAGTAGGVGLGLGLWVVRQVCDAVDIQTGPGGTTIRLHMKTADSKPASP